MQTHNSKMRVFWATSLFLCAGLLGATDTAEAFYFKLPVSLQQLKAAEESNEAPEANDTEMRQDSTFTPLNDNNILEPNTPIFMNPSPADSFQPNDAGRRQQDMNRGLKNVERQVKQFERMVARMEKDGITVSSEIKMKIEELRALLNTYTSSATDSFDMSELEEKLFALEDDRQTLEQRDRMVRELKQVERQVEMFEKQIQKLEKQHVSVPVDIVEQIAAVKGLIVEMKAGTLDQADELYDLLTTLEERRSELEMLARWPKMVKEMNREMKKLDRAVTRTNAMVERLAKKGIDVTTVRAEFVSDVNVLKEVKKTAEALVQEQADEAFLLVEEEFFGQIESTWEQYRVMTALNNVGQFKSRFEAEIGRGMTDVQQMKKAGQDTTELEETLAELREKKADVDELLSESTLDPDALIDLLSEIEQLSQEFESQLQEFEIDSSHDTLKNDDSKQVERIEVSPMFDTMIRR